MTTKTQHLQSTSSLGRQYIQMECGLNEDQYKHKIFETGYNFLLQYFPEKEGYEGYYKCFAYDPEYWSFWLAEWVSFEEELVRCFPDVLNDEIFNEELDDFLVSPVLYELFLNKYIKFSPHQL